MYNEEDNKIKITRAFIMGFTYAWTNTKTFVAEQKILCRSFLEFYLLSIHICRYSNEINLSRWFANMLYKDFVVSY